MDDYIKREDVTKYPIRANRCDKENANKDFILGVESVIEYVEHLPAADVREVKRGKWIGEKVVINGSWMAECSVCHRIRTIDDYCSNCGADMSYE